MWQAIALVSSGVALTAFLGALAFQIFRTQSRRTERLIETAPEAERAALVQDALNDFGIDPTGLSSDHQFRLALKKLRIQEKSLTKKLSTVRFIAVVAGMVAVYGIRYAPVQNSSVSPSKVPSAVASTESAPVSTALPSNAPKPVVDKAPPAPGPVKPTSLPNQQPAAIEEPEPASVPNVGASAPLKVLYVTTQLDWDQDEGATPEIEMSDMFQCGSWRKDTLRDAVVTKIRTCKRTFTEPGADSIRFYALKGDVHVTVTTHLEGRPRPGIHDLGWIKKGQHQDANFSWE
jgi:hypothetical protein